MSDKTNKVVFAFVLLLCLVMFLVVFFNYVDREIDQRLHDAIVSQTSVQSTEYVNATLTSAYSDFIEQMKALGTPNP